MPIKYGEKKLLFSFFVLIVLAIAIGISGIYQIENLSKRVKQLGSKNLVLEKAILEMKINNTFFAMGIRNYVFWKVSHYLGALPMAVKSEDIFSKVEKFREQLNIYKLNSYSQKQKDWAYQLSHSFNELVDVGKQIVALADAKQEQQSELLMRNLFMTYENKLYKIDDFLDNYLNMDNLFEIEMQVNKAQKDKITAVIVLSSSIIIFVFISSIIALVVYRKGRKERLQRQQLFNQMINLEENERKNLSAQVHDQMGQDLSALKISLGLIEKNLGENINPQIKEKIEKSKQVISGLLQKSHNISFMLRPPALDEIGVVESIENLLIDFKHLSGINYVYSKPSETLMLSSEKNLLFYRIVQELLTNMVKYSQAKNVEITIKKNINEVEFYYKDDGRGFKFEDVLEQFNRRNNDRFKLGLLGLKERVELLDGSMLINTSLGKGLNVVVKIHN